MPNDFTQTVEEILKELRYRIGINPHTSNYLGEEDDPEFEKTLQAITEAYKAVDAYLDGGGTLPLIVCNQDWLDKQPNVEALLINRENLARINELERIDTSTRYDDITFRIAELKKGLEE